MTTATHKPTGVVLRVLRNHPVRNRISGLPDYYDCIGDAINAVESALRESNLCLGPAGDVDFSKESGSTLLSIFPYSAGEYECASCGDSSDAVAFDSCIKFAWHRMCSGRVECITYVT